MNNIVVTTTFESRNEAKMVAKTLLDERLIGCAQITELESLYNWENEFNDNMEFLLSVKTKKELFDKVATRRELHSYDLPEIAYFEFDGTKEYIDWVDSGCSKETLV